MGWSSAIRPEADRRFESYIATATVMVNMSSYYPSSHVWASSSPWGSTGDIESLRQREAEALRAQIRLEVMNELSQMTDAPTTLVAGRPVRFRDDEE